MKNKRIKRVSPGFRFGSANRVGPGLEVATVNSKKDQLKTYIFDNPKIPKIPIIDLQHTD